MKIKKAPRPPKFFLAYCPASRKFLRVYFADPCRRLPLPHKYQPPQTEPEIQKEQSAEFVLPELQFEPFMPFPEAGGQ